MKQAYFLIVLLGISCSLTAMEQGNFRVPGQDIEQGKQEEGVEIKEKPGFVQIAKNMFARPGHEKEVAEVIAKFKADTASTMPLEEKRVMAPATLLAKVGLKSEEWNFTMLESQLNKMNIAQFNAVANIVNKDYSPSQRLLHEIIKHQSIINTNQKHNFDQALGLARWWKMIALGTGAGLSLIISLQALYVAINN